MKSFHDALFQIVSMDLPPGLVGFCGDVEKVRAFFASDAYWGDCELATHHVPNVQLSESVPRRMVQARLAGMAGDKDRRGPGGTPAPTPPPVP